MPMNNNQLKVQSAASRLTKLPAVRSACSKLSLLYKNTKNSHPSVQFVCGVLESGVTTLGTAAFSRVSPVIDKLEPQMSIANDFACKSLDWLENSLPVLQSPTDMIVATARNKVHEIQGVVSIAATGTVERVQHTVTWVMSRLYVHDAANLLVMERALSVVTKRLDAALSFSEALVDQVLPPTDEDKGGGAHLVEGFEDACITKRYSARLVSLTLKLCKRTHLVVGTKIQSVQVMGSFSQSTSLVHDLQTSCLTLAWRIHGLPQFLHNQAAAALFFVTQMYHVCSPPSQQVPNNQVRSQVCAIESSSPQMNVVPATPACRTRRSRRISAFENNGCNVTGCMPR
ncbi:perilipin-2-like isoform X2 [Parambassis ranga]|uniref:Perilipin n=1 Tax=Parambassis ranga TaxID=210632 RepID=A0A6P7J0P6_9TELE|nr:perilipin-2-like isoform X2 [Parambassis ranga]